MEPSENEMDTGGDYRTFVNEVISLKPVPLSYRDIIQFISSFTEIPDHHQIPDEEEETKRHVRKEIGLVPVGGAYGKASISH